MGLFVGCSYLRGGTLTTRSRPGGRPAWVGPVGRPVAIERNRPQPPDQPSKPTTRPELMWRSGAFLARNWLRLLCCGRGGLAGLDLPEVTRLLLALTILVPAYRLACTSSQCVLLGVCSATTTLRHPAEMTRPRPLITSDRGRENRSAWSIDYLMKRISEYFGSGHRSSATIRSS